MIETYKMHQVLKTAKIDGILEIYDGLKNIFTLFIQNRENIWIEDIMFEEDSVKFNTGIKEWKVCLKNHIHTIFKGIPDFENKIEFLKKCEKLNLDSLELDDLYISLFEDLNNCNHCFLIVLTYKTL